MAQTEHNVFGWIKFGVPASDCATVKIALEAIIKDLGGVITAHSYTRDDYVPDADDLRYEYDSECELCIRGLHEEQLSVGSLPVSAKHE